MTVQNAMTTAATDTQLCFVSQPTVQIRSSGEQQSFSGGDRCGVGLIEGRRKTQVDYIYTMV